MSKAIAKVVAILLLAAVTASARAQGACVQCWGDFCASNDYGWTSCRWLFPQEPGVCQCIPAGQRCTTASLQLFNLVAKTVSVTKGADQCSSALPMTAELRTSSNSPALIVASVGQLKGVAPPKPLENARCRDVPSKTGDGRTMRLCGDLPEQQNVFSFLATEGSLIQMVEASPPYAQAVMALRNFSQHGGLEFGLDTRMNVNTNPTREQIIRIIRREPISREEAAVFNGGDREAFDVRVLEGPAVGTVTIELQSVKDRSAKMILRLKSVGDRSYTLQEWQLQ